MTHPYRPRRKHLDFAASLQNIEASLRPEPLSERLLPGEELLLQIHVAWYRNLPGRIIIDHFSWYLLVAALVTFVTAYFTSTQNYHWGIAFIPIFFFVGLFFLALHQRIVYSQFRLLKTNARFIISVPQVNNFPLVDTIELKGLPAVVDPNWSKNFIWRVFQFFTGARDVYISLVPYQFVEGQAKVGGALIFPDMMPEDLFDLKRLVFPI